MKSKDKLRKRMLELLEETVQHYNLYNRALNEDGACVYVPSDPTKSEGCAIGRKLPKASKALIVKKYLNRRGVQELRREGIPLGRALNQMTLHFLGAIQELHDSEKYWSYDGISESGEVEVDQIQFMIHDGGYDF